MITAPEGVNQLDVDIAETLICAELGMTSLALRMATDEGWLDGSVISARQGPIVQLLGVTLGTTDATDHVEIGTPWRVKLAYRPVARVRYSLEYVTGWKTEAEIPATIRQAVLMTAQALAANPLGVQSERLGDVSVNYGDAVTPPAPALRILGSWRKPRW